MNRTFRRTLNFLGWCSAGLALLALAALLTGIFLYSRYEERAAKFDLTKMGDMAERSTVYDGNGELYSYFGGENRLSVPLSAVSKHFIDAVVAREDARFWEHRGVDYQSVIRAAIANARAGKTKQGASTITQQLARNACELRARTLDRKALEAVLARHIETSHTKEAILELYVNRIYFGSGFYGIERAARGYFDKSAADLDLGESAMLAAIIRSPKNLSPSRDFDAALAERDVVLDRMLELKCVSSDEAAAAKAQQVKLAKQNSMRMADDYVMDAVMDELSSVLAPETLDFGGLTVFTTIDPQLQRLAQDAADRRLSEIEEQKNFPHPKKKDFKPAAEGDEEKPTDYLQAAVVIIDNRTGAIRAVVGGRHHSQSKYSRALHAKRQIGSTFKPFVYATAFERGMLPGTLVDDARISPGEFRDLPKKWSPENSDGDYSGLQPASFGLIKSRNTMSVRVGEFAGLAKVREVAASAALSEKVPDLPVVFLGGFETTVKDLTAGYTIFPNRGIYRAPFLISSIEDREGRVVFKAPHIEKRVVSPESAWMVTGLLQEVMKSGTAAKSASLGWKKIGAGKTGTTNDFFDAWFVGYTNTLTCGVWVGMDKPQPIMEKGYGSALALPIWVEIMQRAPEKPYPAAPFEPPAPLTKMMLCSVSGARATSACVAQRHAYESQLLASRIPGDTCQTHPEPPPPQAVVAAPAAIPPSPGPAPTPWPVVQNPAPPPLSQPSSPGIPTLEPVGESTAAPLDQRRSSSTSGFATRNPTPIPAPPAPARPAVSWTPSNGFLTGNDQPQPTSTPINRTAPTRAAKSVQASPPVEVRRAIPVSKPSREASRPEDGVTENTTVERTADGRTRTTTVRTVRVPPRSDSDDD
jgi:penicillin-binding protein 1A